ncbi:MAG: EamA family transporter [Gemmatimonadetes bacterium]|nr:EamA family transporter [Gemmatimonadota bacterium]MBK7784691.1 EamA family transporter [Gemmatimonadota bacterium]
MTPEQAARHRLTLLLAFAAIYLIWGSTYLAIAFAIHTIPPLLMAGVRFLVAGGLLYAWSRLRGAPRPRPVQWGWAFLLGALFFLVGNGAVVWVEQSIPSGLVALIVAMVSVWTALLEWLRPGGARPTGMVLVGIALGFAGVALLVLPGQGDAGHADPAGVALLMCSTFAWALASVLSRTADLPASATQVSGMEMLAGGVWLFGASVLHGDPRHFDPGLVTLKSGLSVLYLIVFGSLVTFTAFAWLLQVTTPNKVATAGYVNPMVAVFLGWAFGGEALTPRALLASLVIVCSVVLIITGREFSLSRLRPAVRRAASAPKPR